MASQMKASVVREQKKLEWRKLVVKERRVEQTHREAEMHRGRNKSYAFTLPLVLFFVAPVLVPMYLYYNCPLSGLFFLER